MQKKVHDMGWSDESECQACHKEKCTEMHTTIAQNGTRLDGGSQRP